MAVWSVAATAAVGDVLQCTTSPCTYEFPSDDYAPRYAASDMRSPPSSAVSWMFSARAATPGMYQLVGHINVTARIIDVYLFERLDDDPSCAVSRGATEVDPVYSVGDTLQNVGFRSLPIFFTQSFSFNAHICVKLIADRATTLTPTLTLGRYDCSSNADCGYQCGTPFIEGFCGTDQLCKYASRRNDPACPRIADFSRLGYVVLGCTLGVSFAAGALFALAVQQHQSRKPPSSQSSYELTPHAASLASTAAAPSAPPPASTSQEIELGEA